MVDERKEKAITLIMQGDKITDVAKHVGVARQTLYDWMEDKDFANELDKRRQEIKTQGNRIILNKLDSCIDELLKIALKGKSEKVRSDTAQYLVDRVLGKPTSKVETNAEQNTDNTTQDIVLNEFEDAEKENKK